MKVKVAVNGYGTIGKRVADAVVRQPDMTLVGIAKTRPSFEARRAVERGYPIFLAGSGSRPEFEQAGLPVAGTIDELIGLADIVVDSAPEKVGKENAKKYRDAGVRAIFQGGEKSDVAEMSFNALANYDRAGEKRTVRVVSCNTTGLARAASVVVPHWGVQHWEATIVRRAADPSESDRGPINGIMPTFHLPSHHGPDVRTIFPDLSIATTAVVVPTTLMHVHVNHVRMARPPPDAQHVIDRFRRTPRFHIFAPWEHVDGTPQVMEFARDRPNGRPDMMENVLWEAGVRVDGEDLYFFQAIHQESIVVPENIDAIRAMFGLAPDAEASMAITDAALGIPHP
ncbi:MAG: type II glyceraldehyde-3-phosphate dehydrogenase [Thermoplasmata archaeon]|nr:type II glyceraldehyde-3-phosphate dehydrogenase [Thermoplasmata archaeon]MCI4356532.1 type II glyceraldehyde-3-phosphate dehydrogenase [Thermoplasmata archaeon]